jgi:2-polyprenyl-6-methoxyphenol hydroxylase-like FAD-dependent oxidoreductase
MLAQEGDRWIVTLAGYFGDNPRTDESGFLEFARSLPVPDVYDVIRTATPLSDATSYRFPANQRRRYDKLRRFPEGFLVLGDALCSFTPIYGQGMTVAGLEALALRDCLGMGTRHLAQRFFRRASKPVNIAWTITVGNDARLGGTAQARQPTARLLDWYMDRLHIAARHDARVASAFLRVANLIDAPSALLSPRIALRVLRGNWPFAARTSPDKHAPLPVPVQGLR